MIETVVEVALRLSQESDSLQENEPEDGSIGSNTNPYIHESENQDTVSDTETEKTAERSETVGDESIDAEGSRNLDVAESIRTTVKPSVSGVPSSSATDMVVNRSRSSEIRRQQVVNERSREHEQGTPTSREVEIEAPEPDPRVFPQMYGGTTYGSHLSFVMSR